MPVNRDYVEKTSGAGDKSPLLYPTVVEETQGLPPGEAPDVLELTVMAADLFRRGTLARLEFVEFPGYVLFAKNGELLALANHLGDDESEWRYRRVVLEKVRRRNPHKGGEVIKYVVAPTGEWNDG